MSELLKKEISVTLSFSITVSDKPFDVLEDATSEDAELLQRQRRLLLALISNRSMVQKQVAQLIGAEMEGFGGWREWGELIFREVTEENEIFTSVASTLDKQDAKFFQRLFRSQWWPERSKALFDCFKVEVKCLSAKDESLERSENP